MIHVLVVALCLAGFGALALATRRPQRDILRGSLPHRTVLALRIAGSFALLTALTIVVTARGWALGLVMFSGHTTLAAALVYVALIVVGQTTHGAPQRRS